MLLLDSLGSDVAYLWWNRSWRSVDQRHYAEVVTFFFEVDGTLVFFFLRAERASELRHFGIFHEEHRLELDYHYDGRHDLDQERADSTELCLMCLRAFVCERELVAEVVQFEELACGREVCH